MARTTDRMASARAYFAEKEAQEAAQEVPKATPFLTLAPETVEAVEAQAKTDAQDAVGADPTALLVAALERMEAAQERRHREMMAQMKADAEKAAKEAEKRHIALDALMRAMHTAMRRVEIAAGEMTTPVLSLDQTMEGIADVLAALTGVLEDGLALAPMAPVVGPVSVPMPVQEASPVVTSVASSEPSEPAWDAEIPGMDDDLRAFMEHVEPVPEVPAQEVQLHASEMPLIELERDEDTGDLMVPGVVTACSKWGATLKLPDGRGVRVQKGQWRRHAPSLASLEVGQTGVFPVPPKADVIRPVYMKVTVMDPSIKVKSLTKARVRWGGEYGSIMHDGILNREALDGARHGDVITLRVLPYYVRNADGSKDTNWAPPSRWIELLEGGQ